MLKILYYWRHVVVIVVCLQRPMEGMEWGDFNFQIFSQSCQFYYSRLESLEHFNVLLYIILSTTISFLEDTILFLHALLFFHFRVHFHFFRKYILHVCYVFNVI